MSALGQSALSRARWAPSEHDLHLLERTYACSPFPDARLRISLAHELQVEPRQVQVWFQNRRQKAKKLATELGPSSPVSVLPSPNSSPPATPTLLVPPPALQLVPPPVQLAPPPPVQFAPAPLLSQPLLSQSGFTMPPSGAVFTQDDLTRAVGQLMQQCATMPPALRQRLVNSSGPTPAIQKKAVHRPCAAKLAPIPMERRQKSMIALDVLSSQFGAR